MADMDSEVDGNGSVQPVEILLVDDNDDDIVLLRDVFEQARLANVTHVVTDGEAAVAYLRREGEYRDAKRPGLVLLDINMPKKNGFEVLEEIRAEPELKTLPVVILTTSRREEDVVRSYASGACSFVSKPVEFEKLQQVAEELSIYWAAVARVPKGK